MIVHVTVPQNDPPVFKRLAERWNSVQRPEDTIVFHKAETWHAHPDLLTEIWRGIRHSPAQRHLISEIDFIPSTDCLRNVDALLDATRAVFVPYATRGCGGLTFLEHWPLTGPWFLAFNLEEVKHWPNERWLENSRFLDNPGIRAYIEGLNSGMLWPDQVARRHGMDPPCGLRGIAYQDLGIHAFYARHLDDAPDMELPGAGYTVSDHLTALQKVLDLTEDRLAGKASSDV